MNKPLATATWSDPHRVIERYTFAPGSIWLGRSPTEDETPIGHNDDRHICLVSGSRGGKGTTFIVNNLALWPGSIVVVDPKGENATITAARRGHGSQFCDGMGQTVHVLDPFESAKVPDELRSCFNPLDALDPNDDETVDKAALIASAMVIMSEGEGRSWDEDALEAIESVILHVRTSEWYEGRRNLLTVRRLLMGGDVEGAECLKSIGETEIMSPHALLWEGLRSNPAFRGVIADVGAKFAELYATAPKQYWGILSTAQRHTKFLNSPGIQKCVASSNFRLSDLKINPKGVSLYLSLPDRRKMTHSRWLRMMIDLTLSELEATPGPPASGHRVLICLDEFAGLERMKSVENAIAKVAGYGVKMMFVLQSLPQLKDIYKDNWETFFSNCGLKIFFSLEDFFSREYVSKFIGEEEVIKSLHGSSKSIGTQDGRSHGTSYAKSAGISQQTSFTEGDAVTDSTQQNFSSQHSRTLGKSSGGNLSINAGRSGNSGSSWKPFLLLGRADERHSDGSGGSLSGTYGRNSGQSESETDGSSSGYGTAHSKAHNTSRAASTGYSSNETYGSNESTTHTDSVTDSNSENESIHKRRLITEDEIGLIFKRVTDRNDPRYPGLALVLVSGENALVVRKSVYFEDSKFIQLYDPHPDHEYRPLIERSHAMRWISASLQNTLEENGLGLSIANWNASPGSRIAAGSELLQLRLHDPKDPALSEFVTVDSPVNGFVANTKFQQIASADSSEENCLAVFTYYGEPQTPSDPYQRLEEAVNKLIRMRREETKRQEKTKQEAEEKRIARIVELEEKDEQLWKRWQLWAVGIGWLVSLAYFFLIIPLIIMSFWFGSKLQEISRGREELEKLYRP